MKQPKFIYFGSARFSRIVLEDLWKKGFKPALIISQPDKPKGRGLKVFSTEVSLFADEKKIPLLKPVSLKTEEIIKVLQDLAADFFLVADYGKILPVSMLSLPKIFTVGVHPSLLPNYRGAAPINWVLIRGDKETGITIFKVNDKMDAGQIILSRKVVIEENDNVFTLTNKLAELGAAGLIEAIDKVQTDNYSLIDQDESKVSFAGKLNKKTGKINWDNSVQDIKNLIRGVWGWPSAYTRYKNKVIKIIDSEIFNEDFQPSPSTIVKIDKTGIYVAAGSGVLKIKKLKPEGKREMAAYAFVCGYRIKAGDKFI